MKSIILVLLFIFISLSVALSQTDVAGTVSSAHWTKAGSPYYVVSDLEIKSLVIDSGVNIIFTGYYNFKVTGYVKAIGTPADSIIFTKIDSISGWAGIYFDQVAPGSELAYCKIENSQNRGLTIIDASPVSSAIMIRNCSIVKNTTSKKRGGGIYARGNLSLFNCEILKNSIVREIHPNSDNLYGGGIYIEGTLNIINCKLANNRLYIFGKNVSALGGGIYINGSAQILRSTFMNNKAEVYAKGTFFYGVYSVGNGQAEGGGIYITGSNNNFSMENCLVVKGASKVSRYSNNDGLTIGGGGLCVASDSTIIINSTIADNTYDGIRNRRNSGRLNVVNSIIFFNTNKQLRGTINAIYCNIAGGFSGEGNISFNPNFILDKIDYRLAEGSPCIDAGNPDTSGLNLSEYDLDNAPRIFDGNSDSVTIVDMGCYEFIRPPNTPILISPLNNQDNAAINPDLIWHSALSAYVYSLQLAKDSSFSTLIINNSELIDTTLTVDTLESHTNYYWRVKAENRGGTSLWSDVWRFKTMDMLPEIPELTLPTDSSEDLSTKLSLQWEICARAKFYEVQISESQNFSIIFKEKINIEDLTVEIDSLAQNTTYFWHVRSINEWGASKWSSTWHFTTATITSVEFSQKLLPSTFMLNQNYPNPFNPNTVIAFALPSKEFVILKVFNVLGKEVDTILSKNLDAGNYKIKFHANGLTSGVYIYSLKAGSFYEKKKMLLIH